MYESCTSTIYNANFIFPHSSFFSTSKMSRTWSWNHFISDGNLFRNNNYYKNAWCLACLNYHKEMLRESDIVSTAVDGMGGGRTDAEREAQGSTVTATFFYIQQRFFFLINMCSKNKLPADLRKTIPVNDTSLGQMYPCRTRCQNPCRARPQ